MNETAPSTIPPMPETTVSSVSMSIGEQKPPSPQPEETAIAANPSILEQANAQASGLTPEANDQLIGSVTSAGTERVTGPEVPYSPDPNDSDHASKDHENVPHVGTTTSPWSVTAEVASGASIQSEAPQNVPETVAATPEPKPEPMTPPSESISPVTEQTEAPQAPDTKTARTESSLPETEKPIDTGVKEIVTNLEGIRDKLIETTIGNIDQIEKIDNAIEVLTASKRS